MHPAQSLKQARKRSVRIMCVLTTSTCFPPPPWNEHCNPRPSSLFWPFIPLCLRHPLSHIEPLNASSFPCFHGFLSSYLTTPHHTSTFYHHITRVQGRYDRLVQVSGLPVLAGRGECFRVSIMTCKPMAKSFMSQPKLINDAHVLLIH